MCDQPEQQPADAADFQAHAQDVDHEMSQFLRLHAALRSGELGSYPDHIARAVHVAYATHYRALEEFFHDGNPAKPDRDRLGVPKAPAYVRYRQFPGGSAVSWSDPAEIRRYDDATKLAAHLTTGRRDREDRPSWGNPVDFQLVGCKILRALREVPGAAELFPATVAAANEVIRRLPFEAAMCEGLEER